MVILDRIKKGLPEFWEQATIVINQYHPNSAWGGGVESQILSRHVLVFASIWSEAY